MREVTAGALLSPIGTTVVTHDKDGVAVFGKRFKMVTRTTRQTRFVVRVPTPAEMNHRPHEDEEWAERYELILEKRAHERASQERRAREAACSHTALFYWPDGDHKCHDCGAYHDRYCGMGCQHKHFTDPNVPLPRPRP